MAADLMVIVNGCNRFYYFYILKLKLKLMDGLECEEGSSLLEGDESNENIKNSKLTSAKRCAPQTKRKKKQQTFCKSWLTVPEFLTNFKKF